MFKYQGGYTVIVDLSIFRYIFFCDASKLAHSAVVFLRVDIGSTVHIQLVQSKTRIAPCGKKETTIARLELLGAVISTRLSTTILKEFPTDNVYFWTDSTTLLAWLKREEPWGVLVYNHVQEIRKLTPVKVWRHISGSLNPADCPSRGCSAKQLCSLKWWEVPSWLNLSSQEWPISDVEVDVNEVEVNKERRAIA
ncbi:integrase_H2C2 domain-containing protein [Trichonephila clavipes]|nr:integrase_H2C2 domain-containing protein [Trichonephila clavipes]